MLTSSVHETERSHLIDGFSFPQAGFTNVRIPVCWDGHTGGEAPYTIDKAATTTHGPATGTGTLTLGQTVTVLFWPPQVMFGPAGLFGFSGAVCGLDPAAWHGGARPFACIEASYAT